MITLFERFRLPWRSGRQIRQDVHEEIAFHLEMRVEALVAEGLDPESAQKATLLEFGDLDHAASDLVRADAGRERSARRRESWGDIRQDVRYACRGLIRSPSFTFAAVTTLALGIGATTAVFTVVNGVVLEPAPYPAPDRLAYIAWDRGGTPLSLTPERFDFIRENARTLDGVATFASGRAHLGEGPAVRVASGVRVSDDFFGVVATEPAIGRPFTADESRRGGPDVVIVGHHVWRDDFAESDSILGDVVSLQGRRHTVVGVMPAGFRMLEVGGAPDYLVPLRLHVDPLDRGQNYLTMARLAAGATRAGAAQELEALTLRHSALSSDSGRFRLSGYREVYLGNLADLLWILLVAVGFVLLIGCANIANLLLVRGAGRGREMGIRAALGAGRSRILRQLLTESLVLSLIGGVAGIAVGTVGVRAILVNFPEQIPRPEDIVFDLRVLAFAIGAISLTGLFFGLAAALPVVRASFAGALNDRGRSVAGGRGRFQQSLVAGEAALAIVLLTGAGLLIGTVAVLRSVNPGYRIDGVLSARVDGVPVGLDDEGMRSWRYDATRRIAALPGVQSAALSTHRLLDGGSNIPVEVAGGVGVGEGAAQIRTVSPGYFRVLDLPLLRGRPFDDTDSPGGAAVVIVSESFANRYWPDADPLGKSLRVGYWQGEPMMSSWSDPARTVVGITADVRDIDLSLDPLRTIYVPIDQFAGASAPPVFLIRSDRPVEAAASVRELLADMPGIGETRIETLATVASASIATERFLALLMGLFAGVALVLTMIGIYGVLSFTVAARTKEIGVRLALGARPRSLVWRIVRGGMGLTAVGLLVGSAGALMLTRLLAGIFDQMAMLAPMVFGSVVALLVATSAIASLLPALRASRLDPIATLRSD